MTQEQAREQAQDPARHPAQARPTSRDEQRQATRSRLLRTAVETMIECGVARTTTLEVQQRAGVSRGTLLHHFPTRAEMLSATIREIALLNEKTLWQEAARTPRDNDDGLAHAIRTLASALSHPSYLAELELWAAARADAQLRTALRDAEREVLAEREKVLRELFVSVSDRPGYPVVLALSIELSRGLAVSDILRSHPSHRARMIDQWIGAARMLIDQPA